jgi:hypothetical protein
MILKKIIILIAVCLVINISGKSKMPTGEESLPAPATRTVLPESSDKSKYADPAKIHPAPTELQTHGSNPDGKVTFGVISDVHVGSRINNGIEIPRLNKVLDWYTARNVDAFAVVGDMTQDGTADQLTTFGHSLNEHLGSGIKRIMTMGNHEHNNYAGFESATSCRANAHYVINGYHFIAVSPGSGSINEATGRATTSYNYGYITDWVAQQVAIAEQDGTDKPVFVFFHHPVVNTYYVTDDLLVTHTVSWGTGDSCIFTGHPRVVTFSGHIHSSNNDPRSIWQDGGFIAVNTSALCQFELEHGYVGNSPDTRSTSLLPKDNNNVSPGMLVSVNGSKVEIKNYDFISDQFTGQTWTFDVTQPMPYTNARAQKAQKPVFDGQSGIAVKGRIALSDIKSHTVTVTFPQACLPVPNEVNEVVHSYRFDVYDSATGAPVHSALQWSDFIHTPMQPAYSQVIGGLQQGTGYELRIYAIGSFQKVSDQYLTTNFTTLTSSDENVLTLPFRENPLNNPLVLPEVQVVYRSMPAAVQSFETAGPGTVVSLPEKGDNQYLINNQ